MEKLSVPFHCIITGPTNCGKTRYLIEQLRGPFKSVYDWVILICPTYDQNRAYRGFAKSDKCFLVVMPDSGNQAEIEELLDLCDVLFSGTNTLIFLDDCEVSKDLKNRSSKFIEHAFSGRHRGLSVWVLTQQLTSIAKPFRDNVGCVVSFHNPSQVGAKTLFEDSGGDLDMDIRRKLMALLKSERYSRLCFCLQYPFKWYLELPAPSSSI